MGCIKDKGDILKSKYHSLAGRRGKKRALIAVGHKILIMCYFIMKYKVEYKELGEDYLDSRKKARIVMSYTRKLSNLGYKLILEEVGSHKTERVGERYI